MRGILSDSRGVSLIEATIVLSVVAILAAAAAPVTSRTLDRARQSRALDDEKAIRDAITNFFIDVTDNKYFTPDGQSSANPWVDMLVSDGDTPREASITNDGGGAGVMRWDDPVNNTTGVVDFLERHLVTNTPRGSSANDYPTPKWRGAYLSTPVDGDPWGNRYAANVRWLIDDSTLYMNDVFVWSSGPDEQIDTLFQVNGATPGGDDIIVVVRRDGISPNTVP